MGFFSNKRLTGWHHLYDWRRVPWHADHWFPSIHPSIYLYLSFYLFTNMFVDLIHLMRTDKTIIVHCLFVAGIVYHNRRCLCHKLLGMSCPMHPLIPLEKQSKKTPDMSNSSRNWWKVRKKKVAFVNWQSTAIVCLIMTVVVSLDRAVGVYDPTLTLFMP